MSVIEATRYFEIVGEESNALIRENVVRHQQGKGKNDLARQFNCSMTFVQCTLYRKSGAASGHPKSRQYYLKMESRNDICINVQKSDVFLSTINKKEISELPPDVEIIDTYGSP